MNKTKLGLLSGTLLLSCVGVGVNAQPQQMQLSKTRLSSSQSISRGQLQMSKKFDVNAEAFADLQLLRYRVPGFDELTLQQKTLAYYLYEAALSGRDIYYDQASKYGLTLRKTIEAVYGSYKGDKNTEDWNKFKTYAGRVWFSTGNHHHYGKEKFIPECSFEYFSQLVKNSDQSLLPLMPGESTDAFLTRMKPVIFDPNFQPKQVDLRAGIDNVANSSVNFSGLAYAIDSNFAKKNPVAAQKANKGFLQDILSDGTGYSVQRIQAFAWNLVLGVYFIIFTINNKSMPEFSTTILFLAGISSASYLGAKGPENSNAVRPVGAAGPGATDAPLSTTIT